MLYKRILKSDVENVKDLRKKADKIEIDEQFINGLNLTIDNLEELIKNTNPSNILTSSKKLEQALSLLKQAYAIHKLYNEEYEEY